MSIETQGSPVRVLIAEDHAILRLGLRLLLQGENIEIVGEAEDGWQAVELTASLQPEVVLMDVSMPVMNGIEAARKIRRTNSIVKIIMFTSTDNDDHVYASLGAGVNGYCLKEISAEKLVAGINMVRDGDLWLDSNIAAKVVRFLPTLHTASPETTLSENGSSKLNSEELQVLNMMVEGLPVSEVAGRLSMDEQHVRQCEQSIIEKLATGKRVKSAIEVLDNNTEAPREGKVCTECSRAYEHQYLCCPYDGAQLVEFIRDPLVGTIFADRYEIQSRLGKGGMSVVYKARHLFLKRTVAVKVLNSQLVADVNNARRFRQEAEAASSIRHPNIISVFDFGLSTCGQPYLVMDYIEGQTLDNVIDTEGSVNKDRAINIFLQVADGLAELHRYGIVHRDLKPSNIMLYRDKQGRECVCLIDFGIAQMTPSADRHQQRLTRAGEVLGSPCYISPEQAQNFPLDVRSDIYSLGCTMYETLCGELPFHADFPWETMLKHVTEPVMPLTQRAPKLGIPETLNAIVMCAMEKSPSARFQNVQELQQHLMFARLALV
ncbi:MAG: protein kinase [Candidatus Obscuribacterales bacterium]